MSRGASPEVSSAASDTSSSTQSSPLLQANNTFTSQLSSSEVFTLPRPAHQDQQQFSFSGRSHQRRHHHHHHHQPSRTSRSSDPTISTIPEDGEPEYISTSFSSTMTSSSIGGGGGSDNRSASCSSASSTSSSSTTPSDDENVQYDLKSSLTDLLNCESVRHDSRMRCWVQARLMEAELELKRQRRRRVAMPGCRP